MSDLACIHDMQCVFQDRKCKKGCYAEKSMIPNVYIESTSLDGLKRQLPYDMDLIVEAVLIRLMCACLILHLSPLSFALTLVEGFCSISAQRRQWTLLHDWQTD